MKCLVTGPGGFLGRYIVEQLLSRGDSVRGFARGEYPELSSLGVELVRGDLADPVAVARACKEIDCVFHVAGRVGVWGKWKDYFRDNVRGTLNMLAGCQLHGVGRMVFTSSPSVTFAGGDQCNVDESAPYPIKWLAHYPRSKALAEQYVLAMNGEQLSNGMTFRACALRPHLVWGPRDHHLTARLVERARAGQLRRVGERNNLVDMIYVENAAAAHLAAADALAASPHAPAGKAYFLSQGEPVNCWQWIDDILALVNLPPVQKSLSEKNAYRIGVMLEAVHWLTRNRAEPRMTRFVARQLATHHYFNIAAAQRDFGYRPLITTSEGMRRLGAWLNAKQ